MHSYLTLSCLLRDHYWLPLLAGLGDDLEVGLTAMKNTAKPSSIIRQRDYHHDRQWSAVYSDFDISSVASFIDAQLTERWNSRPELGHSENRENRDSSALTSTANTYRDSLNWQTTDVND